MTRETQTATPRRATESRIRCQHCGHRDADHRVSDSRCPISADFPNPPRSMNSTDPEAVARGEALWDRRIAKHWDTKTTFRPRV